MVVYQLKDIDYSQLIPYILPALQLSGLINSFQSSLILFNHFFIQSIILRKKCP